jgi:CRP-like cAMP-binding protein
MSPASFFDYPNESPVSSDKVDQLLADAAEEEWTTLLKHTIYRRYGPGDPVVTAGARDQSLYLVPEGQLEVLVERGRRGHGRIASIGAGSVIGELSLVLRSVSQA